MATSNITIDIKVKRMWLAKLYLYAVAFPCAAFETIFTKNSQYKITSKYGKRMASLLKCEVA